MKVAFWRAYASDRRWHTVPPLAFTSLTAHARHVGIPIEPVYCTSATELLAADADLYGISSVTGAWPQAKAVAEALRDMGKRVVIGGPHITCLPENLPEGCLGVVGEGEEAFTEILEGLKHGWDCCGIPGTIVQGAKGVEQNISRQRLALLRCSHLPVAMAVGADHLQAVATRGCPYRCWFCCASRCWGKVTRFAPDYVAGEIGRYFAGERDYTPYPTDKDGAAVPWAQRPAQPGNVVTFQDLHFASDADWLFATVDAMKAEGAPRDWHVAGCSYSAKLAKPELLAKLKEVGIEWLGIGVESGSPKLRKKLKPHLSLDDDVALIRLAKRMGIKVCASFIVGIPGETEADLAATRDFIAEHTGPFFQQAGLFCYVPYPGTPGWDELLAQGKVSPDMDMGLLTNGANPSVQQVGYYNTEMPYATMVRWHKAISKAGK